MKIMVIPDTQVKPGSNYDPLYWAGLYAANKRPDVIVHIGDHWDMESLSSYDEGKKSFEGRSYVADIRAGRTALSYFEKPIKNLQAKQRRAKSKVYKPRKVFTIGNHEERINRAVELDRKLEGLMSLEDLKLEEEGWEVYPFLQPVKIGGVMFCHYFVSGVMGRPVSSARILLNKKHMSCVMGHVQDRDFWETKRADGKRITGLFAGIFYEEDQGYLNPQTNDSWRGIWMLNEVKSGSFDLLPVSLDYLRNKYANSN
jgi:hypothetical protein